MKLGVLIAIMLLLVLSGPVLAGLAFWLMPGVSKILGGIILVAWVELLGRLNDRAQAIG